MEEKEKLVTRINEVKNNKQIIQEWMVAENNRMREENVLRTAREDGLKEGIKKGIKQGIQEGILQGSVSAYAHSALSLVENLHIDMEAAIQALDIPEDLKESVITTTTIAAGK